MNEKAGGIKKHHCTKRQKGPGERTLFAPFEVGADVNARTCDQENPLHLALGDIDSNALGSLEIVRTLVEEGADVNAQTEHGLTPMRILRIIENAYEDDHELIEPYSALLLEAGDENC